ncbi:hypothetical protein ACG7TL_001972 [Trametes sanguinea]
MKPMSPGPTPLLALHELVVLDLRILQYKGYLSAEDVWSMTRVWPKLARLCIEDCQLAGTRNCVSRADRHIGHVAARVCAALPGPEGAHPASQTYRRARRLWLGEVGPFERSSVAHHLLRTLLVHLPPDLEEAAPQAALPRLQNMKSRMVYLTVPYSQLTNLAPTSLRSLSITLDYCEEQPISYLEESWDAVLALLPRCPDLASIHFAASISLDHPEQCLHLVVKGHSPSKLRTLSLRLSNDCAVHFVWDLAPQWFSSLETLKIDTSSLSRNRCQRPLSSIPASSGKFLFLVRRLKLYTSILRAAALLSATTSKTLMSLGLKFRDVRTNADQPLFLGSLAIPLQQFSSTLQYLSISLHWEWGRALVETALEPVTPWLGPLLSLHGLVEFNIYAEGMTWILSTTDIWSMARAWPHITWLQVKDSKYELMGMRRDRDLQVTPIPATVLLAFAEHCPNLQYLSLVPLYLAGEGCSVLENWHPSADSVSAPQLRVLVTNILPLIEETPGRERLKTIEPPSQMQPFLNAIFPNAYCVFWAWRSQFVRIQPANQHI